MISRLFVAAMLVGLLAAPAALTAQNSAPLVRERPQVDVTVPSQRGPDRERQREEPTEAEEPAVRPARTPDPALTLVAIVNGHKITRADLDCRVAAITGATATALQNSALSRRQETEGLVASLVGSSPSVTVQTADDELREHQELEYQTAIRQQEEQIVYEWIDQMMLADEARRQGFIITQEEFQSRKRQFDREFDLANTTVDQLLESMCMDRAQLESYLYDAMLIERLLDRFVELNYPEDRLRATYESNPGWFMTPPAYRIARFTVSVSPNDSNQIRRGLERRAQDVRSRMRRGEDPQTIFEEVNDIELGVLGSELVWAVTSEQIDPQTRQRLEKMKPGEVSDVYSTWVRGPGGDPVPEAFHVIKLVEVIPTTGDTYESARPKVLEMAGELARESILERLIDAGTHRAVMNMSGISPDRVPSATELRQQRPPIDLRIAGN